MEIHLKVTLEHFHPLLLQIETALSQYDSCASFTSINGDGEVWANSQGPQGTSFGPQQGFYFIELLSNAAGGNDASYWDEAAYGSNGNYDRILVIENVYPNRSYGVTFYHKEGGRFLPLTLEEEVRFCRYNRCKPIMQ